MPSRDKRLGGLTAKKMGAMFENTLGHSARLSDLNLIQIPQGAEYRKRRGRLCLTPVKSPFDFILQKKGSPNIFFDAKTRAGDSITYSDFFGSKSTKHQLETMVDATNFGTMSGFVVWFRASNRISFFSASKVATLAKRTSLGPNDGTDLGTLENIILGNLWE